MRIHCFFNSNFLRLLVGVALLLNLAIACQAQDRAQGQATGITPDLVYGHKDGLAMTMDMFEPKGESNGAAILFMVSGGWYSKWSPPQQMQSFFAPYLTKGYRVFAVRHGSSPRYSIPEAVSDVRRAVRFVRSNSNKFGVDSNRLGVMGMSAGGHLSLMLGTSGDDGNPAANDKLNQVSSRVAAVVALVPPTDLRVAVWDAPESLPAYKGFPALNLELEKAGTYSPLTQVTSDDAPALVIMGGKDKLVPKRHGEWIAEAFKKEKVPHKLIVYPDAGHGLEGSDNRASTVREAVAWFDTHLLKSK